MTTDEERRVVARRLRACKSHIDAAGWFWLNDELGGAHVVASSEERLRSGTSRLANLIDPGDMSQGRRDSVACDRYTLLALADVLEVHARKITQVRALINDKEQKRIFDNLEGYLLDIAACIREALGVTS